MKTKQTTCITRLLGLLLLATGLSIGACTSEMTDHEVTPPTEIDTGRREVLLTFKNKLSLLGGATRGLATAEENELSTLDVYVFGSETENGTYTFQECFSYRTENAGDIPFKSTHLPLAVDIHDNSKTTGLLGLKKGLYVKLYCVANNPELVDPATGNKLTVDDFTGLKLREDASGTVLGLHTPGIPTESDFLSYHTPLLTEAVTTDVLVTPLPMSGAYTTPIDLTDPASASRLNIGFKLTRMVTRFDVLNNAAESRFTIKSISMGKGRRGATFFPIAVCDAQASLSPDKLITYPERPFDGAQANQGLKEGAFYSYASPQADGGYLILKGDYQVNATEQTEVSYQVPFRQLGPDGQEAYIDINHNHRYTIGITNADEYHLDFTLKVEDWADDGSVDDYVPDNKPGEITLGNKDTETEYVPDAVSKKHTVKMSLVAGANFEAKIAATAMLQVTKTYAGGIEGQQYDWLKITAPPTTFAASQSAQVEYTYNFTLTSGYAKGRFPRATIRFFDPISGSESILFVEAISAPTPVETKQPSKAPNGSSPNPNGVDLDNLAVSLYRITDSRADVTITCADEVELESNPTWLTVKKTATQLPKTTYSIVLNSRDVVETTGKVVFRNVNKTSLITEYTVNLLDAPIKPKFENLGTGNSFTPDDTGTTLGDLVMNVASGNKVAVITTPMDGVTTKIDFDGGPEWLRSDAAAATTRAVIAQQQVIAFSLQEGKLAGAKKATVTLVNKIGGKNEVFTVTPKLNVGKIEKVSSLPIDNTLSGTTMTLYKLPVATSEMKLKVTSYGGSTLTTDNDHVTVTKTATTRASSETQDEVVSYYTLTPNSFGITQLTLGNRTDPSKTATYTINVIDSRITVDSESKSLTTKVGNNVSFVAGSPLGFNLSANYGKQWVNTITATDYAGGAGKTLTITANNSSNISHTEIADLTITLKNKIVDGGDKVITAKPIPQQIPVSANAISLDNVLNVSTSTSRTITEGSGYKVTSSNTKAVTVNLSGNTININAHYNGFSYVSVQSTTGCCVPTIFTVSVKRSYDGGGVLYYRGYYIAPTYISNEIWWNDYNDVSRLCDSKSTEGSWMTGTTADWQSIIGVSGLEQVSPLTSELEKYFPISTLGIWTGSRSGNTVYYLATSSGYRYRIRSCDVSKYSARARCISKQ